MKVLVFGCNGLLGQNLIQAAPENVDIYGSSVEDTCFIDEFENYRQLDIGVQAELKEYIRQVNPDRIINAAALTNVDLCEKERDLCTLINRDSPGWMAQTGIPMAHISSDYVFDGKTGPYSEENEPAPIGFYGRIKLESERLVLRECSDFLIVRTMLLWGTGSKLRPSFVDFVRTSLEQNKSIRIVTDQIGNPTIASDLARGIWKLLENSCKGIYNICGSEIMSRYDWALTVAEFYGLNPELIQSCSTAELNQAAKRPLNSGLITDKLINDTGFKTKNMREQLAEIDNRLNKTYQTD